MMTKLTDHAHTTAQAMQRIKVGATGLAAVLLIIALASAVLSWVSKEQPVAVAGAPKAEVIANLTQPGAGDQAASPSKEPLAELGITPSAAPENNGNTTAPAQPPQKRP